MGFAELQYRNDPFPFYYVEFVFIREESRGSGLGRAVLGEINTFLDSKRKPGILCNAISENSPAKHMYENHGWTKIDGHEDYYSYQMPHIKRGQLEKALYSIARRH
ncbi:MAG: GNAT family N-acetyltransferase [Parcubacteria group bacterium]|nr:GNAT family N-acetyltransferase [Parcubacteria group bacterium]